MYKRKKIDMFSIIKKNQIKNSSFFEKKNFIYKLSILKKKLSNKKINVLLKNKNTIFREISNSKKFLNKKNETKFNFYSKNIIKKRHLSLPNFKSHIAENTKSHLFITKKLFKNQKFKNFQKLIYKSDNAENKKKILRKASSALNSIKRKLKIKYKKKIRFEFPMMIKFFPLKIIIEPENAKLIIKIIIIGDDFSNDLFFKKNTFIIKKKDVHFAKNKIRSIKFLIQNNGKNSEDFNMKIYLNFKGFLKRKKRRK